MNEGLAAKKIALKEKYMRKKIGQAIRDYDMIQTGDRLCVAVSGGQDSLSILKILSSDVFRKSFDYHLMAVHVKNDMGQEHAADEKALTEMFDDWRVPYCFGHADIAKNSKKKINCFWCAWSRRKIIFETAEKFGCNKVVFGHHKDDIIETMLLNLFFNGEISTMNPKQSMFDGKITIIRPLCYTEKNEITAFAGLCAYPSVTCKCPYGDMSKRKFVRDIIALAGKQSPVVKSNIFRAPSRIREEYLAEVSGSDVREARDESI